MKYSKNIQNTTLIRTSFIATLFVYIACLTQVCGATLLRQNSIYDICAWYAIDAITNHATLVEIAQSGTNKWMRLEAAKKINNQTVVADLAQNHDDAKVREAAVQMLDNHVLLEEILKTEKDDGVLFHAERRLGLLYLKIMDGLDDQELIANIATNFDDIRVRRKAIGQLENKALLADMAQNDDFEEIRIEAAKCLDDQNIIAKIALSNEYAHVRVDAVRWLTNQDILAKIAKSDKNYDVRQTAVRRLTDRTLLADLTKNDGDDRVRQAAAIRLGQDTFVEAPKRLDWMQESIHYDFLSSLAQEAGWMPLREMGVPSGSLEARVWISPAFTPPQVFRLCRDGEVMKGFFAQQYFPTFDMKPAVIEFTPRTGWADVWKKLDGFDMLTLPDSSILPNEVMILDGVSYFVEINDGERYRFYHYDNPKYQTWHEAEKIVKIIKTLFEGFVEGTYGSSPKGNHLIAVDIKDVPTKQSSSVP